VGIELLTVKIILLRNFTKGLVFNEFPKCHMKMLLLDFVAEVGREDIFKAKN
jgi:hypothetical protein